MGTEVGSELARAIGRRIVEIRGVTPQHEFATRIGIHKNTLSRYERGLHMPDAQALLAVSEACHVSIEWLVTGESHARARTGPGLEDVPKEEIKAWLDEWWGEATPDERSWLKVEMGLRFPAFAEWQKRRGRSSPRRCGA
ncbi:MAG TPA: hypothetical protein DFS52_10330 [Myxococcales bacterium]|jgi:transcriptional regulator with XRE-family HTH domain|nr:hypothetical protein [Myxococcales bacterium]